MKLLLIACLLLAGVRQAAAQIMMSTGTYTQDFNTLQSAGTANAWTDNVSLTGWYAARSVTPQIVSTYRAGTGLENNGALYSFGLNASGERALGSVASLSFGSVAYGVRFTNDTPYVQTNLVVVYTGEQWRCGGSTNAHRLAVHVRLGTQALTNLDLTNSLSPWIALTNLDFVAPVTLTNVLALDGNAATNRVILTNRFLAGISVAPGQECLIRWLDQDDAGADHGLAIDNVGVSFVSLIPPPNDAFADRILLPDATNNTTGGNQFATKQSGEPNHAGNLGGSSVWWTWTAPTNGMVIVDTDNSSFDTLLGVYRGAGLANLALVAGDDDSGAGLASRVAFPARMGTNYQIAVDGYFGAQGNIVLHLQQSPGVIVAVFDEAVFVDTAGGSTAESDNLQASLASLGFPVGTFTGFAQDFGSSPVVVIPELENNNLATALAPTDTAALQDFVRWGGTLIVHGSYTSTRTAALINHVLTPGTAVIESAVSSTTSFSRTSAANGTTFADDPPVVNSQNGTDVLAISSLPIGAVSLYSSGDSSVVALLPYGTGQIIFLGWDWYDAAPVGSQDGGWLQVLASAVSFSIPSAVTNAGGTNDQFTNRVALVGDSVAFQGTNAGFTIEAGEPTHSGALGSSFASAWYSWTAPWRGGAVIEITPSLQTPMVAVYQSQGNPPALNNLVKVADNSSTFGELRVAFTTEGGREYFIAVDSAPSFGGSGFGSFSGTISLVGSPVNDAFNSQAIVGMYYTASGSLLGGGREPGEPAHGSPAFPETIWWSWTAPTNVGITNLPVRLMADSTSYAPALAVYTGSAVAALTPVGVTSQTNGFNNGQFSATRMVAFTASPGSTYHIALAGYQHEPVGNVISPRFGNYRFRLNASPLSLSVTNLTVDGAHFFTGTARVTSFGPTLSHPLRIRTVAVSGDSVQGPDSGTTTHELSLLGTNLLPVLAAGQAASTAISGFIPTKLEIINGDGSGYGRGYGAYAYLEEQDSSGNWRTVDHLLIGFDDWPQLNSFPGPGGGVIRLDPGYLGLAAFNPLQSVQVIGPATLTEGSAANYLGRATYADTTSISFTDTMWTASRFTISSNGLFSAGVVTSNSEVMITAPYSAGGFLYNATTNITVSDLPPPRFMGMKVATTGGLELTLAGVPNRAHVIEATTNLALPVQWWPMATNTLGPGGVLILEHLPLTNAPQQFYRAREASP